MAIPIFIRKRAQKMRVAGKSLKDIAHALSQSKSTVSYWCRDIELTDVQVRSLIKKQRKAGRVGALRAAQRKHARRLMITEEQRSQGRRDVGKLTERDIFISGLSLYWGEGYKRGNEECGFTNTDPRIIMAFIRWMKDVYGINKRDLILRVSINETQKGRAGAIEQYWSRVTTVPASQFTRTSFIKTPHKKSHANVKTYFGTLRVKVRRATNLRRRIMGSLEELGLQIQATN
ncbi:MAG TPA: hypothetical protein VMU13_03400 [Candidatus Paceibacterota bacterium]|nr:hypothetical protein [Candidatus Paceibacterota bacterium]